MEGALHKRLNHSKGRPPSSSVWGRGRYATIAHAPHHAAEQAAVGIGSKVDKRAANCDRPAKRAMKQFGMRQGYLVAGCTEEATQR